LSFLQQRHHYHYRVHHRNPSTQSIILLTYQWHVKSFMGTCSCPWQRFPPTVCMSCCRFVLLYSIACFVVWILSPLFFPRSLLIFYFISPFNLLLPPATVSASVSPATVCASVTPAVATSNPTSKTSPNPRRPTTDFGAPYYLADVSPATVCTSVSPVV
jgi:hypothetical protein